MRAARKIVNTVLGWQVIEVMVTDPVVRIGCGVPTGYGLPIERLLGRPGTAIVWVCGDAVTRQVVAHARVAMIGIHGQVLAVRQDNQSGRVVVIFADARELESAAAAGT